MKEKKKEMIQISMEKFEIMTMTCERYFAVCDYIKNSKFASMDDVKILLGIRGEE